jgi:hypothetical protein
VRVRACNFIRMLSDGLTVSSLVSVWREHVYSTICALTTHSFISQRIACLALRTIAGSWCMYMEQWRTSIHARTTGNATLDNRHYHGSRFAAVSTPVSSPFRKQLLGRSTVFFRPGVPSRITLEAGEHTFCVMSRKKSAGGALGTDERDTPVLSGWLS